jgi:hypothetical protein
LVSGSDLSHVVDEVTKAVAISGDRILDEVGSLFAALAFAIETDAARRFRSRISTKPHKGAR